MDGSGGGSGDGEQVIFKLTKDGLQAIFKLTKLRYALIEHSTMHKNPKQYEETRAIRVPVNDSGKQTALHGFC